MGAKKRWLYILIPFLIKYGITQEEIRVKSLIQKQPGLLFMNVDCRQKIKLPGCTAFYSLQNATRIGLTKKI
jgi:hypothetical protein